MQQLLIYQQQERSESTIKKGFVFFFIRIFACQIYSLLDKRAKERELRLIYI